MTYYNIIFKENISKEYHVNKAVTWRDNNTNVFCIFGIDYVIFRDADKNYYIHQEAPLEITLEDGIDNKYLEKGEIFRSSNCIINFTTTSHEVTSKILAYFTPFVENTKQIELLPKDCYVSLN